MLDWLAQLLGLPRGLARPHRGHGVDATVAALAAARTLRPGGVVYASEQANFSVEKAARLVGLDFRKVDGRRRVPDARRLPARRRDRRRRDGRDDVRRRPSIRCPSSRGAARRRASGCTSTPRTPGRPRSAPSFAGASTACERADSVVVNPHKWLFTPMDCSALWTRRPEVLHETFALVPDYLAATDGGVDIKDYGPALGRRFRALKLWFVLRWYGAEGLRALIREHVRLAQLFASLGRGRAGLGGRRAASVLDRLLPARRGGQRRARARGRPRPVSCSSRRRSLRGQTIIRLAIGNARDDRGRRPPRVGGAEAVRA